MIQEARLLIKLASGLLHLLFQLIRSRKYLKLNQ